MDEFKFVLKCFGFAAFFLVITQIKTGDKTIERHIESSLVNSKVSDFVNKAAAGGAKLINDGYHFSLKSFQEWKTAESSDLDNLIKTKIKASSLPEPKVSRASTEPVVEEDDGSIDQKY